MKTFKPVLLLLIAALILTTAVLAGCGETAADPAAPAEQPAEEAPAAAEEPIVLVMNHSSSDGNPLYTVYNEFARLCEEKSAGRLLIEVHSNNELGTAEDAIQLIQMDAIDVSSINSNAFVSYCNAYEFIDLPYLFNDNAGVRKVFDGEIGERLKQQVEDEIGIKVLMYNATGGGFRVVANKVREVRVPADMEGLKIRATNSEVEVALLEEWNCYPTPIAFSETYTSLQQGVVEGEHIQIGWITQGKHEEIVKYVTEVQSMTALHIAIMDAATFNSLPEDLQNVVLEAAEEAEALSVTLDEEYAASIEGVLTDAGVAIYKPTEEEMALWRETGNAVWDIYLGEGRISQEFIDEVLATQSN